MLRGKAELLACECPARYRWHQQAVARGKDRSADHARCFGRRRTHKRAARDHQDHRHASHQDGGPFPCRHHRPTQGHSRTLQVVVDRRKDASAAGQGRPIDSSQLQLRHLQKATMACPSCARWDGGSRYLTVICGEAVTATACGGTHQRAVHDLCKQGVGAGAYSWPPGSHAGCHLCERPPPRPDEPGWQRGATPSARTGMNESADAGKNSR